MNFLEILGTVAPVFLIVAVGFVLRRIRWMHPEADASVLKIGVNLLLPALIADTVLGNPLLAHPSALWFPPLLAFVVVGLSMLVIAALLAPLRLPKESLGAAVITAGVQNYGYMAIPLVEALCDREAVGLLFVHNLGVEIAMWTLGVWALARGGVGEFWRRLCSGPPVAIVASLSLNLVNAQEWIPLPLRKSLHMLGQAAIPLALLLTGATIFDQVRERRQGRSHYGALSLALAARMAALPVLILAVARWVPLADSLRKILVIQGAMPAAMMPAMICRLHQADSRMSVQIILASTAVSLLTIPLWIKVGMVWIQR